METLIKIFGEGKDLNTYQMCARGFVVYFIALALIRISGRRTFGKKSSFDNTIAIILGAILSRAVVGASDFVPTIVCCFVLALMHRALAWLTIKNATISTWLKGKRIPLFDGDKMHNENLNRALISTEDIMSDIRLKANENSLKNVKEICMETTGEVSVVLKR
ncbi:DUF421 domain-containing protein [soil metagenome]|jgi:uncharacterized membrane protein YcaP (DUF421 family)